MILVMVLMLFFISQMGVTEANADSPNLIVSFFGTEPSEIKAGDSFLLKVKIQNTSKKQYLKNMVCRIDTDGDNLRLLEDSNMSYIERMEKGAEKELSFRLRAEKTASHGSYPVTASFSYESSDGSMLTMTDILMIYVTSDHRVEFKVDTGTEKVNSGNVYDLPISLTNYSADSIYNAEFSLEVDGLKSLTSLYIGNMEGGTQKNIDAQIYATYLMGDPTLFGYTQGVIRLIYETPEGDIETKEEIYEIVIERPIAPEKKEEQEKKTDLVPFIVGGAVILAVVSSLLIYVVRRQRKINV